jgi:hypothetical protein
MKFSVASFAVAVFASSASAFAPLLAVKPAFAVSSASQSALFSTTTKAAPKRISKTPVFDEVCDTTGVTLKRFMAEVAMLNPDLAELVSLFGAIDTAGKAISNMVKRSQLPSSETLGYQGAVNVQGEDQKVCSSQTCPNSKQAGFKILPSL